LHSCERPLILGVVSLPPGLRPDHPARAPYREAAAAAAYAEERFRRGTGPATDRREREVLSDILGRTGLGRGARVLDCPAGAGRLADLLAARGFAVAAADQSEAMLAHAGGALAGAGIPRRLAAADALALPFRDGSFDLVLCHRLLHHLETEGERRALLGALARASRRFVLLSWFDAASLQHLRRALRRPFRPSRRHAVTRATLVRDAAAAGLRPLAFRALRPLVSELSFVLLETAGPR
jgi:SAM-dependent methyltransferase